VRERIKLSPTYHAEALRKGGSILNFSSARDLPRTISGRPGVRAAFLHSIHVDQAKAECILRYCRVAIASNSSDPTIDQSNYKNVALTLERFLKRLRLTRLSRKEHRQDVPTPHQSAT